jgi:hypothetical protein
VGLFLVLAGALVIGVPAVAEDDAHWEKETLRPVFDPFTASERALAPEHGDGIAALAAGYDEGPLRFSENLRDADLEPIGWPPQDVSALGLDRGGDTYHGIVQSSDGNRRILVHASSEDWTDRTQLTTAASMHLQEVVAHGEQVHVLVTTQVARLSLFSFDGDTWSQRHLGEARADSGLAVDPTGQIHVCASTTGGLVHMTGTVEEPVWEQSKATLEPEGQCEIEALSPDAPRLVYGSVRSDTRLEYAEPSDDPDGWDHEPIPLSIPDEGGSPPIFTTAKDGVGNTYIAFRHTGKTSTSGLVSDRTGDWQREGLSEFRSTTAPLLVERPDGQPPTASVQSFGFPAWSWRPPR